MKRLIFIALLIFSAMAGIDAQTTLDLIREDPFRAQSQLYRYHPLDTSVTKTPRGYKAFYISHIGRHGSRFHTRDYAFRVIPELQAQSDKGNLTEEGKAVLSGLKKLRDVSEGNYGALTAKGAMEHRVIAKRMYRHYPEVFNNPQRTSVMAYSTNSPRVMESRKNFIGELGALAPALKFTSITGNDVKDGESFQEVRGRSRSKEQSEYLATVDINDERLAIREPFSLEGALKRWFKNPAGISQEVVLEAFDGAKCRQCLDDPELPWLEKYFTTEEMYCCWTSGNAEWFNKCCVSDKNKGISTKFSGGGVVEMVIKDADAAIAGNDVAATLRFSHDGTVLPVEAFMGLEGVDYEGPISKEMQERVRDFQNICMAGNVQMIFYRNRRGNVIVKILKNEKEVTIPALKTKTAPFYKWSDLKAYFERRLSELPKD